MAQRPRVAKRRTIAQTRAAQRRREAMHARAEAMRRDRDPIIGALEKRAYDAARITRLTSDWSVSYSDANEELRNSLPVLRAAARHHERNTPTMRKYLALLVANVVGDGFTLQSVPRGPTGALDESASQQIEAAWLRWAARPVTLDGRLTWADVERIVCRALARDGEVFVRLYVRAGNLRLQVLEADYCPIDLHQPDAGTLLGIRIDADGAPTAYFLHDVHPGSRWGSGISSSSTAARPVPAADVLQIFAPERPGQVRGAPWSTAALDSMLMLAGYCTAELAAARLNASRPASVETERDAQAGFTGDATTDAGQIEVDGSPGGLTILDPGQKLVWAPAERPSAQFGPFIQEVLRQIAAALGISYASLASDLSEANYSSLRHGKADENRYYAGVQSAIARRLHEPVFERWLELELLAGRLALPVSRLQKFLAHEWHGPIPEPVDAMKDAEAWAKELELGITTRKAISAGRGKDWNQIIEQLAVENDQLAKAKPQAAPAAKEGSA